MIIILAIFAFYIIYLFTIIGMTGSKDKVKGGSVTRGAHGHEYYYSCDNCHNTIRIYSMR